MAFLKRLIFKRDVVAFHTLRRGVVYFLRANIKGEVWLIVSEWEIQRGIRGCPSI